MIFDMSANYSGSKLPVLDYNYPADKSLTVIKGNSTSATFSVSIAQDGKPANYTYQWYVNGNAVSGATSSSYTKSGLTSTATYKIYCVVTNKAGSVTSRTATLSVTQYYTPVLNSSYPANATVTIGNSVTAKVTIATAGNPANYTYQWYVNGNAVSGATSSSYEFTPTAVGTTTVYCKVKNAAGTVKSRTATITTNKSYLIKDGVIDMTAHPYTVTENSSNETKATNSVTYNGKPALRLVGRNGAYATFSFANVTVPSRATVFYVETYCVCTVDSTRPKITIGGVSGTMSSDDNPLVNKTLSLDVSSISGKTSALTFRFMDGAWNYHWHIGNAWFQ